jgi:hypothetical protein
MYSPMSGTEISAATQDARFGGLTDIPIARVEIWGFGNGNSRKLFEFTGERTPWQDVKGDSFYRWGWVADLSQFDKKSLSVKDNWDLWEDKAAPTRESPQGYVPRHLSLRLRAQYYKGYLATFDQADKEKIDQIISEDGVKALSPLISENSPMVTTKVMCGGEGFPCCKGYLTGYEEETNFLQCPFQTDCTPQGEYRHSCHAKGTCDDNSKTCRVGDCECFRL